jgi:inhibitor of KinA sporulation pathway (predicted exonuclease)
MTAFPQICDHAVVFDLEFTAWEGSVAHRWSRPGEFTEIVQIGAVKVDARSLDPVDEFDLLVRPRLNPVLSDYLVGLTGITNNDIAAHGVDFAKAYADFVRFVDGGPIAAYGRDDLVFETNIRLYGLKEMPPIPRYTNIIPWLFENGVDPRGKNACDVAPLAGVPFEGRKHNARDDARGVIAGIRELVARGARNPLLP